MAKKLVLSVGTAALTAATGASAQDQVPTVQARFEPINTLTIEGGLIFSKFASSLFNTPADSVKNPKLGLVPNNFSVPLDTGNDRGIYGAIYYRRDLSPTFDWRLSGAVFDFKTNEQWLSGTTQNALASNSVLFFQFDRLRFETMDFDLGHKIAGSNFHWRTFIGVRGIHVGEHTGSDTAQRVGGFFFNTNSLFQTSYNADFYGIGPRIGADFTFGSVWAIVGSISASASWGRRNENFAQISDDPAVSSFALDQKTSEWLGNLSGMLGLSWSPTPNSSIVIAYRLDRWINLRGKANFATGANRDTDLTTQIPFLRVTVNY